jgi:hypothetical protein
MRIYEFEAVIQKHEGMDVAYIEFPFPVDTEFGTKGQVKVKVYFDGFEYRGSLANMGMNCHCVGVTQQVRQAIGKKPGDMVKVKMERDTELRVVELPEEFAERLKQNQDALLFYESLSFSRQKAYVTWITSAKRTETRKHRVEDSIRLLINKMNSPF